MKKISILALSAVFSVMTANAQQTCCKNQGACEFVPSWFVNVQGGVQMPYTPGDRGKLLSPAFSLNVGRNVNRYFTARLGIEGAYSRFRDLTDKYTYHRFTYATGSFDGMLNVTNVFCQKNHPLNFYVLGGVGLNWSGAETTNSSHFSPNVRLGAQLDWRISRNCALNLEYRADNTNDQFNSRLKRGSHDWYSSILVGVSLVLPDRKAAVVVKDNSAEMEALNKRINELQAENEKLKNRPAEVKEVVKTVKQTVLPNVFFKVNKCDISSFQQANVKAIADYLKANKDEKIVITGYASPEGNADHNMVLSEQRAKAVADMLVNKYGIAADRISTKAGGATSDIYPSQELNRVAVTVAK